MWFEPRAAGWKARKNPLSYGGTPNHWKVFNPWCQASLVLGEFPTFKDVWLNTCTYHLLLYLWFLIPFSPAIGGYFGVYKPSRFNWSCSFHLLSWNVNSYVWNNWRSFLLAWPSQDVFLLPHIPWIDSMIVLMACHFMIFVAVVSTKEF